MEVLRTPDERFESLPEYDFEPHYAEVQPDDGPRLRYHYVEEGPSSAAPVVLLHGNPSWSFLHRRMIRGLAGRGHRVLALDLMGLGRSDKPDDPEFYTLERHVLLMSRWFDALDLEDVTLYCQDWGGTIGLNVLPLQGRRVSRVVASNTGLPVGEGENRFMREWLAYSQSQEVLPIAALVDAGTTRELTPEERAAYDAPFPDGRYQASAKRFPVLIPVQPDNPGVPRCKATWGYLAGWDKPFLTAFSTNDPVAYKPGAHLRLQQGIPGAAGQPHVVLEGPGHFLQEDASEELVDIIDRFVKSAG